MKPGEKITLLRRAHSYSVTDIAIKLNVSSYDVMDWEAGKKEIPQEYLYPLCSMLEVTVSDFLDPKFTPDVDAIRLKKDETRERTYEPKEENTPLEEEPKTQATPNENPFYKQYMDGGKPLNSSGEKPRNVRKISYSALLVQRWIFLIFEIVAIGVILSVMINVINMNTSGFMAPFIFVMFGLVITCFCFSFFFIFVRVKAKRYKYLGHEVVSWQMFTYKMISVDGYTQSTSENRTFGTKEIYAIVEGHKITFEGKELVDESGKPLEKYKK